VNITNVIVSAFNCTETPPAPTSCNTQNDFMYSGVVLDVVSDLEVDTCCNACESNSDCAVFTLNTNTNPWTCTLFSANSGGVAAAGYISGAPSN